jgi:hypothetical protein
MSRKPSVVAAFVVALGALYLAGAVQAQSVVGSKHDFSSGSGDNHEVCVYCHTPHSANTNVPSPLWNRVVPPKTFDMYTSPTMDSPCAGWPTGPSIACMGCHDGNLAYTTHNGNRVGDKHDVVNAPGPGGIPDTTTYPNCERCHQEMYHGVTGSWRLGGPRRFTGPVNLANDHPISMTYPTPAQDPAFETPPDPQNGWAANGESGLRLYNGKVECPTCHNVHNPTIPPFLRASNANSSVCKTCHIK